MPKPAPTAPHEITITLTLGDLDLIRQVVREEIDRALEDRANNRMAHMTLTEAAKFVRRRRDDALAAAKSGALKAANINGRWHISPDDARAWAAAGYPIG